MRGKSQAIPLPKADCKGRGKENVTDTTSTQIEKRYLGKQGKIRTQQQSPGKLSETKNVATWRTVPLNLTQKIAGAIARKKTKEENASNE